jgi:hypothetical protein
MRCDVENGADEARVEIKIDMNGLAEIRCQGFPKLNQHAAGG